MGIRELETEIKKLKDRVEKLEKLIGQPRPPSKRYIDAIGKHHNGVFIPAVVP